MLAGLKLPSLLEPPTPTARTRVCDAGPEYRLACRQRLLAGASTASLLRYDDSGRLQQIVLTFPARLREA